jgi:hypothetical protein
VVMARIGAGEACLRPFSLTKWFGRSATFVIAAGASLDHNEYQKTRNLGQGWEGQSAFRRTSTTPCRGTTAWNP